MNYVKKFFLDVIQVQLVVTLVSLPILVSWGLPISLMVLVGNFIFTPLLIAMIIVCSILFFTELLGISNGLCVYALDMLTHVWSSLLSYGNAKWLVAFAHPGEIALVCMFVLAACVVFFLKKIISLGLRIVFLGVILMVCVNYLRVPKTQEVYREKQKKFMVMRDKHKHILFIDDGYFKSKMSATKAIAFELQPYLIKKFGTMSIDELIDF